MRAVMTTVRHLAAVTILLGLAGCPARTDTTRTDGAQRTNTTRANGASQTVVIQSPRLGVLNLGGTAGAALAAEDLRAFGARFGKAVSSTANPPECDVLLIYADIDKSGRLLNHASGLREIIRDSKARIAIVASDNPPVAYLAIGTEKKPYGAANLVMTTARNGDAFPTFFAKLFARMFAGAPMTAAWLELAPQGSQMETDDAPDTVFAAELGEVVFR